MRLAFSAKPDGVGSRCRRDRRGERGSAAIVVLVLLFLIVAFAEGNSVTLRSLKRELQLLDERQLKKYGDAAVTNAVMPKTRMPAAP